MGLAEQEKDGKYTWWLATSDGRWLSHFSDWIGFCFHSSKSEHGFSLFFFAVLLDIYTHAKNEYYMH